jgi:hypothetical protein
MENLTHLLWVVDNAIDSNASISEQLKYSKANGSFPALRWVYSCTIVAAS